MINLTPHPIVVRAPDGTETVFAPSGQVARVSTAETVIGTCCFTGAPIITRTMGEASGLPEDSTPCLVSALVLSACQGRPGVFAPDTGPTALRDERGQIVAVTRLVAA